MRLTANVVMLALLAAASLSGVRPAWLGFGYLYTPPTGANRTGWMVIVKVTHGAPAERAGLRPQDVVTAIDGKALRFRDDREIVRAISTIRPNQRISLDVIRGKQRKSFAITAAEMPDDEYVLWKDSLSFMRPAPQ